MSINLPTMSLPEQLALALLILWITPRLLPFPLRALAHFQAWLGGARPSNRAKARLAPIRQSLGSPPIAPDYISDHALLDRGFSHVEMKRTAHARRVVRHLRSRNCPSSRVEELEMAIRRREYARRRRRA